MRKIESVDTPINPIYVQRWFGAVSVADAINGAFERIFDRALCMATRYGESTIIVPFEWKNCSRNMSVFLNANQETLQSFCDEAGGLYNCTIHVSTERQTGKYVELNQCVFHLNDFEKNVGDIPTHWDDNEEEYTWAQVCEHGQYYLTSSSESWPRPEYVHLARLEKMRAE